jgi:hypothetical protein
MKTYIRRTFTAGLIALGIVSMPGCEEFVQVENPNSLETDAVDPERDASLLSQSVFTRFISSTSNLEYSYILGAWFVNHIRVGDTFPTRNAVGQRNIPDSGNETDAVWNSMHTNIQFARTTINAIKAGGNTIDLARAHWVAGFSIMAIADNFCEGTIAESTLKSRPKMTVAALYDSAIVELQAAQTVIAALPAATTESNNLTRSAQVGIARALLQLGRLPQAATAAAAVPAGFSYSILHIDNTSQRGLGNQVWSFSEARRSIVVGPEFRAMADAGDTRIAYTATTLLAQDGVLPFIRQGRHPGYAANMRFASKLEAQYIEEEANQNPITMLAFINARRAAGSRGAYGGATDMTSLMAELMLQKSIDFWLEGHNMRDFRRNPTVYPFVLPTTPAGAPSTYYKPSLGPVGEDVCWPVPRTEKERNLEWNKGA